MRIPPRFYLPRHPTPHPCLPNSRIIKDKIILSFCVKTTIYSFMMIFSISISVFFSYTKKNMPLNILKFLKGKFSHMRWYSPITSNLFSSVTRNEF